MEIFRDEQHAKIEDFVAPSQEDKRGVRRKTDPRLPPSAGGRGARLGVHFSMLFAEVGRTVQEFDDDEKIKTAWGRWHRHVRTKLRPHGLSLFLSSSSLSRIPATNGFSCYAHWFPKRDL